MAYGCIVASVDWQQVEEYRNHQRSSLKPSKTILCSHLVSYWVKTQPIGRLLGEAIDGGDQLRKDLWHPLLEPVFHPPAVVAGLSARLTTAWEAISQDKDTMKTFMFGDEIPWVVDLFQHATLRGESVVRFIDRPFDKERAQRVVIPIHPSDLPEGTNL